MAGWWAWAMSFPVWGDGSVSWQDAIPVIEDGKLVGVRAVDCEAPK